MVCSTDFSPLSGCGMGGRTRDWFVVRTSVRYPAAEWEGARAIGL
ncbi:hypothetical protein [Microcoleus sp. CAWBG58]|nr:hypothetical protein [Microcoleus sp. CAWBG58]